MSASRSSRWRRSLSGKRTTGRPDRFLRSLQRRSHGRGPPPIGSCQRGRARGGHGPPVEVNEELGHRRISARRTGLGRPGRRTTSISEAFTPLTRSSLSARPVAASSTASHHPGHRNRAREPEDRRSRPCGLRHLSGSPCSFSRSACRRRCWPWASRRGLRPFWSPPWVHPGGELHRPRSVAEAVQAPCASPARGARGASGGAFWCFRPTAAGSASGARRGTSWRARAGRARDRTRRRSPLPGSSRRGPRG